MLYQLNYGRTLVGLTGFEPATLCSQSRCATKLRYSPTIPPRDAGVPGPPASRASNSIFAQPPERYPRCSDMSACLSALSAAPRWLIAFFSARESSAIVLPGVACGKKSGS